MQSSPNEPHPKVNINTNTGISIGIVVIVLSGFALVLKGNSDLALQSLQTNNKIDKLETRMTTLEAARNSWTHADMFRWAVHLQQSNSDPKKIQMEGLKVPEPESTSK